MIKNNNKIYGNILKFQNDLVPSQFSLVLSSYLYDVSMWIT